MVSHGESLSCQRLSITLETEKFTGKTMKKTALVAILLLSTTSIAQGQDLEDFLACAEHSDRVERVFCLESALDAAIASEQTEADNAGNEQTTAVENFGQETTAITTDETETDSVASEKSGFRLPVIGNIFRRDRSEPETSDPAPELEEGAEVPETSVASGESFETFGRDQTRIVVNEDGKDELHDVIADLERIRSNLWEITLVSGQVWRQTHVRRFNLRKGDQVKIYPTAWGDNYRLEVEGLSGFIQVGRMK
jgi:hypothetical protein